MNSDKKITQTPVINNKTKLEQMLSTVAELQAQKLIK